MLFNSYTFLLFFLPATLLAFEWLQRRGQARAGIGALVAASLFFYGWWNPRYLLLLAASILANHAIADRMLAASKGRRAWLMLGVGLDLAAIGWFKYAGFFAETTWGVLGIDGPVPSLVLPLAISFFTFQQIAYLVDVYRGTAPHYDLLRYALFVSFFPQLIAGPIVRHEETIPQFDTVRSRAAAAEDRSVGASLLVIGLFKKVVIADTLATFATPVFASASFGAAPGALAAWGAALAYSFQLYFDFSGYCDMAIGAARLFGIRLPSNFDSPYRATSIIDFWRRWHQTLSRFLRDYLYVPLGGNRKGPRRRYVNLMVTMLLGGLWHGAGWTFVLWGGAHGLMLVVNHGWRAVRPGPSTRVGALASGLLTFTAVVLAWVMFRAADLDDALRIYSGMLGQHGLGALPGGMKQLAWLVLAGGIAFCLPNSQQWMADYRPVLGEVTPTRGGWAHRLRWRPSPGWAAACAGLGLLALTHLTRVSEFLYFQF